MDAKFHPAVAAIKSGDLEGLKSLLERDPTLATARSSKSHPTLLQCVTLDARLRDLGGRQLVPVECGSTSTSSMLGCAIWAVGNSDPVYRWPEANIDWLAIVRMLIDAGAKVYEHDSDFPTGNEPVDELLRRHGMRP